MSLESLEKSIANIQERVDLHRYEVSEQFPIWPDDKRGSPNSLLRSSLFSTVQSKDRRLMKDEQMFCQKGVTILFSGEQLNQEDLRLFDSIVQIGKCYKLGEPFTLSGYCLLKDLSLPTGGREYIRLYKSIKRMAGGLLEVISEKGAWRYCGTLIDSALKDDVENHYIIRLNPELVNMYGGNDWTITDPETKKLLRGKNLALFLYTFYSTHSHPFPLKVNTLHALSGSQNKNMYDFKRKLKVALKELIKVHFLQSFSIENNLVKVDRINKINSNSL